MDQMCWRHGRDFYRVRMCNLTSAADDVTNVVRRTAGILRYELLFLVTALHVCWHSCLGAVLVRHRRPSLSVALGMNTRTYPSKAPHFLVGHVSDGQEEGEKEESHDTWGTQGQGEQLTGSIY